MSAVLPDIPVLDWDRLDAVGRREALARAPQLSDAGLVDAVAAIIAEVRQRGDEALAEQTARHEGVRLDDPWMPEAEVAGAPGVIDEKLRRALESAQGAIRAFHEAQRPGDLRVETAPGIVCERRAVPLRRVGLYVPGGSAPLLSTVMMLAVPAVLAGCEGIVLCTPPGSDGRVSPALLAAAALCGVTRVCRAGGAQAVAAMAYGTRSVPRVDKIFGPGNAWVTEAKRQVAGDPAGAACDLPAGPSEVMVVADASADPMWVAADLLSQAEHGPDSQALLVTDDRALAGRVLEALARQLGELPRRDIAREALTHSRVLIAADIDQAMDVANAYAPEHLILNVNAPRSLAGRVRAAGSVFLGPLAPEAVGDYASGTNHVLPTYGWARSVSGLSLESFMLWITFQELTRQGLQGIGESVRALARAEGLDGHERAVALRLEGGA